MSNTKIIHISVGGSIHQIRDARGKVWRFEMHRYCGPCVVKQNDDPVKNQPGERSPFWTAVQLWIDQGQRVGADGFCIWDVPEPPKLKHLGGKHYLVLP